MSGNLYDVKVYVTKTGYVSLHVYESNLNRVQELHRLGFKWREHGPSVYDCYVTSRVHMTVVIPKIFDCGCATPASLERLKLALQYANAPTTDERLSIAVVLRKLLRTV